MAKRYYAVGVVERIPGYILNVRCDKRTIKLIPI